MSEYAIGIDILGDMGTGSAPSVPYGADFGPGTGNIYTDAGTVRAVQQLLAARGHKVAVDGVFGAATEAALRAETGISGPPNDASLAKMGIKPGGAFTSAAAYAEIYAKTPLRSLISTPP